MSARRWRRDDGFAMAVTTMASTIMVVMLIVLSATTLQTVGASRRAQELALGRALAEAALDDTFGRMVAQQNYLAVNPSVDDDSLWDGYFDDRAPATASALDCGASDTSTTCFGLHPALVSTAGAPTANASQWQYFDATGKLGACPDYATPCFYLKYVLVSPGNYSSGTAYADSNGYLGGDQFLRVEATARVNCRGDTTLGRCSYVRLQQTLRKRKFTDYLLLSSREVVDPWTPVFGGTSPSTCPEWPEGVTSAAGLPVGYDQTTYTGGATVVPSDSVRGANSATFGGCYKIPYGGFTNTYCMNGCTNSSAYVDTVKADGPSALYLLDDTGGVASATNVITGAVAPDTRAAATATYVGTPTQGATALAQGTAVTLNGTSQYLTIAPVSGDVFYNASSAASVELWFSAPSVTNRMFLYEEGDTSNGMNVYVSNSNVYVNAWSSDASPVNVVLNAAVSANTTYHLVFTAPFAPAAGTVGVARLYLNGAQAAEMTISPQVALGAHSGGTGIGGVNGATKYHDVAIGGAAKYTSLTGPTGYFNGTIDAVARYSKELSFTQVAAHYAAAKNRITTSTPYPDLVDGPIHTNDDTVYACYDTLNVSTIPTFTNVVENAGAKFTASGYNGCSATPTVKFDTASTVSFGSASAAAQASGAGTTCTWNAIGGCPAFLKAGPTVALPQSPTQVSALVNQYKNLAGTRYRFGTAAYSRAAGTGCKLASAVTITLQGTQLGVTSPCDGINAETLYDLPTSGVVYAQGTVTIKDGTTGCGRSYTDAVGSSDGGLSGKLTIVVKGYAKVGDASRGSVTYCGDAIPTDDRLDFTTVTDLLGVLALPWTNGEVKADPDTLTGGLGGDQYCVAPLPSACTNTNTANATGGIQLVNTQGGGDVVVQAALAAPARSVYVAAPDTTVNAKLGRVLLFGSIVAKYRPLFSTYYQSQWSGGMLKSLHYDTRLQRAQPPYFIRPVQAPWERLDLIEVPGNTTGIG